MEQKTVPRGRSITPWPAVVTGGSRFRKRLVAAANGRVQRRKAPPPGEQPAGRRGGQRHEQPLRPDPRGDHPHVRQSQLQRPREEQRQQQLRDEGVQQEIVAVERRQPGRGDNRRRPEQAHLTMEVVAKHLEPFPLQEQPVRRDHRI